MGHRTPSKDINYNLGPSRYVWGVPHPDVLAFADTFRRAGHWLNFGAGDGRYNDLIIDDCDSEVVFDFDPHALDRLIERTSAELRGKISRELGDATEPLPFSSARFDGVLCTGMLHYFEPITVRHMLNEVRRVSKRQARLLLDFAVDVQRECPDGTFHIIEGEPLYSAAEGERLLRDILAGVDCEIKLGVVPDFPVKNFDREYIFRCNVITLLASKVGAA